MSMQTDVLVVGGGPSGLAAAIELRRLGVSRVLVAEREAEAGGIPRHCYHTGYGIRDFRRLLTGPAYAQRYVQLAKRAGVQILTETSVTGWLGPTQASMTSSRGIEEVEAKAVILATGCRERPRSARLVPGTRPQGIFTTGSLQQLTYLHHQKVGNRAVVIGAEHVSFSALLTLSHAGTKVIMLVTEHPHHQTYWPLRLVTATRLRVPVLTGSRLTNILGRERVRAVEVTDLSTGKAQLIDCDTVVFTGDWVPEYELAQLGGLETDSATKGPRVDQGQRTSVRGVFAAGNLLHAAETADIAALCGRHVARFVRAYLESGFWPDTPPVPIECEKPVSWVSPSALRPNGESVPHGHFILRMDRVLHSTRLTVRQGDRVLWGRHYRYLLPNVPVRASAKWVGGVASSGGPVIFSVAGK